MQRRGSLYFTFFLIILSIFILFSSLQIETAGKPFFASPLAVPIILSSIMFIASIFILIQEIKADRKEENSKFLNKPALFFGYFVLVLAYVLSMKIIGFNVATFLFLGIGIIYLRGTSIFKSILLSLAITILIVSLFGMIFEIVFPAGQFEIPLRFF